MNQSPIHDVNARLGARFVDFGGWEMPVHYGSVLAEHRKVREACGFFDVSHLGRFRLTGPGSAAALDRLLSNDMARIEPGRTQYTLMLNEDGGVVDDLIVWWWGIDEYWVLPNGANHQKVMKIFSEQPGCVVEDLQETTVMAAIQGPGAIRAFDNVLGLAPARFRTARARFQGSEVFMAGTGYTGESGGELVTDVETARSLVEAVIADGVTPCGLGARDTLRLEAGLPLWGEDMDESTSALEAGLGFAVAVDRDFVGSSALRKEKERGSERRLAGFVLHDRGIPRHGHETRSDKSTGLVTSGNMSPILETGIGLGYFSPPVRTSDSVEVEIRDRWAKGRVVKPPFHKNA